MDNFESIQLFLDEGLDLNNRQIYLSDNYDENADDGINSISTEKLYKHLSVLSTISSDPITIILNTAGGETSQGMAMYDIIKSCKCKVIIKVVGDAHSMGSVILQAADERIMTKNSTMLLHYGQTSIDAESDNFKRWQQEYERLEKVMELILLKKMRGKVTKKQLREMMKFDTILDATKALKFGLIDRIEE